MSVPTLDSLFENAACGLLLTGPDGTIRRVNATFCSWVGFSPDELVNTRRVQQMLTIGSRVFHQTHWAPLMLMQGSVSEVKLDILHRDGRSIPILVNAIRRDHDGDVYDEIAIMVATDRQKYERELVLARRSAESANERLAHDDRRKDEFLATLAHELRGPLAPMSNVLQMMRHKEIGDPDIRWSRDVLGRQLAHITRLVEDLMEVSRIKEGKLRLRLEPVALRDAVERAVEAADPLIRAAHQQLTVPPAKEPLWINADLARVTQIILNLLVNASKFSPPGGQIDVSWIRRGNMASCTVSDSGIGIAEHHLASVFEMFSQSVPALERTTGGLGIGLALVRGLVELHGGTVQAFSAGPGQGSQFVVTLPLGEPPSTEVQVGATVAMRPRKILIVDDNVDSAESLAMILAMDGHETRTAHDGASAIDLVASGHAEVVLLDLGLPDLSGFEVARRLRSTEAGRGVMIIATTGWGQPKDFEASARAGFDHHLVKPIDLSALSEILSTWDARE
ncbi:MAG: ATP-binding protein [Burkholderiaceae bacterium]